MPRALRSTLVAAAACVAAVEAFGSGACVVAPPAKLLSEQLQRPTILHGSVVPAPYQNLTAWTSATQFVVPVELDDVNEAWVWDLFIDYNGDLYEMPTAYGPMATAAPQTLDGGVTIVSFTLDPGLYGVDLTLCHTIEFLVGHAFLANPIKGSLAYHAFDDVGYDSVSWTWTPPGAYGCNQYAGDAGGPVADASDDMLPIPPTGGDP